MQKITVKKIIEDNWDMFKEKFGYRLPESLRGHIYATVEKSLTCGNIEKGYAEYMCLECGQNIKVGFTCKSKFCIKCGRLYTLKWAEKQQENMLDVKHRHSVFTIPEELRNYFYKNRNLLKDLMDGVYQVIDYYYKNHRGKSYEVGVIAVIHTFGRDLKWNPHVHALVTEGAINNKYSWWKSVNYIPYSYLRKAWQKIVLDIIKKNFQDSKTRKLINTLYKTFRDGFYVNAERELTNTKQAAKYIGRYLARAAIAEYRIVDYDGHNVTFWYEDHETHEKVKVTLDVLNFIGKLVQQIQPKGFKCVRRYGLYSRKKNKLSIQIVKLYHFVRQMKIDDLLKSKSKSTKKKSWKERIIECFNRNPIECRKCKREMELWRIWHDDYGTIYDVTDSVIKGELPDEKIKEQHQSNGRDGIRRQGTVGLAWNERKRPCVQISMPEVRIQRVGPSVCGR